MTTVLIVDDHAIVRFSLRILFERERFRIVGELDNGSEVAQKVRELRPGWMAWKSSSACNNRSRHRKSWC